MSCIIGGGIAPQEPIVAVSSDGIVPVDHAGSGVSNVN